MAHDDRLTETLVRQLNAVRESGLTNLFDRETVNQIAEAWGYDELANISATKDSGYGPVLLQWARRLRRDAEG